jgi:uncharacterized membrane protein YvlD (DUF360 family)
MKRWIALQLLLLALLATGLMGLPLLFPQFYVANWQTALQVGVCLLLVELLVQPLMGLWVLPFNWLTLGLAGFLLRFLLTGVAIALAFLALPTVGFKAPPPWLALVQVVTTYAIWASGCLTVFKNNRSR